VSKILIRLATLDIPLSFVFSHLFTLTS